MLELAPWIAVILTAVNGIISAIDKRIIKKLIKENALTEETAVHFNSSGSFYKKRLRRLNSSGIICAVGADRFYFLSEVYKAQRRRRIRNVLILAVLIVIYLLVVNVLS